jgi:hypothetical protein
VCARALAASACCLARFGHFSLTFLPTVASCQVSPSLDATACLAEVVCEESMPRQGGREGRVDSFAAHRERAHNTITSSSGSLGPCTHMQRSLPSCHKG